MSAASGRILSIAVHEGPIAGLDFGDVEQPESQRVFGIDEDGAEQDEKKALLAFLEYMKNFDPDSDELVGHNIIGFDLPFIFQRCLVHGIVARPLVDLGEYRVRGVFDTMHHWWLGAKRNVSLDDIAWALGIESSKTATAEGSKVFELYQAGKLGRFASTTSTTCASRAKFTNGWWDALEGEPASPLAGHCFAFATAIC